MHIRLAQPQDAEALVALWRRSVTSTHRFLSLQDVEELEPVVRDEVLCRLEVWVLEQEANAVGFMALNGPEVGALFLDPAWFRRGGGHKLLAHARQAKGRLRVDVNEQNPEALRFYMAEGFEVVGRSERDGMGRAFPLLHLQERVKR